MTLIQMTHSALQFLATLAKFCHLRAQNSTELEYKYLQDELPLTDSDGVDWGKCDACGTCFHLVCWEESRGVRIQWNHQFYCCKYE